MVGDGFHFIIACEEVCFSRVVTVSEVIGSYYSNSISLKRIDERTIEQTYKRDGKVVGASTTTVSLDGQKLTSVWTESGTRRKVTEVAYRQ
jgi:hypothetical protein